VTSRGSEYRKRVGWSGGGDDARPSFVIFCPPQDAFDYVHGRGLLVGGYTLMQASR
jgi:hypothetical protein